MENMADGLMDGLIADMSAKQEDYYIKDGLRYCNKCNTPMEEIIKFTDTFIRKVPIMCKHRKEEQEKRDIENRKAERALSIKLAKDTAFADKEMQNFIFSKDDMQTPEVAKKLVNYCKAFKTMLDNGNGLILMGDVGTGKTYYAACIVNELIENGYTCKMTSVSRVVGKLKEATYDTDPNRVLDKLCSVDLLVLDDFGTERKSEFMLEQLYNIVDNRYRKEKPLILTTNITIDELKKPGDMALKRIYDRVIQMCVPVVITGQSRRRKAASINYKAVMDILNG